jgi:hypothetical protein
VNAAGVAELGRAFAESLMTSTCSIAPRGATPVTDEDTGEVTFPDGVAVYTGKCRVRPAEVVGTDTAAGGAELRAFDYLVSVPFAVADVRKGHRLTITASLDPALVGRMLEVQDVHAGDHISARRLLCSEVT